MYPSGNPRYRPAGTGSRVAGGKYFLRNGGRPVGPTGCCEHVEEIATHMLAEAKNRSWKLASAPARRCSAGRWSYGPAARRNAARSVAMAMARSAPRPNSSCPGPTPRRPARPIRRQRCSREEHASRNDEGVSPARIQLANYAESSDAAVRGVSAWRADSSRQATNAAFARRCVRSRRPA
jgi:hypothetical protein